MADDTIATVLDAGVPPLWEGLVLGLERYAGLVRGALHSSTVLAVIGFSAAVLAADILRRGLGVAWPHAKMRSALATLLVLGANIVVGPIVMLAATLLQDLYDAAGVPRLDTAVWENVPAWILVPLAILAYDFANYWNHRAMHRRWLWPIHAVHHSDEEMSGLTTLRIHALESLVMLGSYTLLLSWLGFPPGVTGGAAVLLGLLNAYVHVDVDWGHGPLRHVIASPRFHRWHHADTPAAYGKNLANVFPFFDVLFGTYYVPGPCRAALGVKGVPSDDAVRLLLFPFTAWSRMITRRLRRLAPQRRVKEGA